MNENSETKNEKLTVDQAAEHLPLKASTIRTFCRQGRIPSIKLGKSYFVDMSTIVALLDGSLEVGPPPARDEVPESSGPDEV